MIGIGSIGLGIVTTYGLAGLFGVKNTSMNSILPFLLLGIGIDDMFVIVQSFTNIKVRFDQEFLSPSLKYRNHLRQCSQNSKLEALNNFFLQ